MDGDKILLGMNFIKHLEMTQKGNELIFRFNKIILRVVKAADF